MKRWMLLLMFITLACVTPIVSLEMGSPELTASATAEFKATPTIVPHPTFTPTPYTTRIEPPPPASQPILDPLSIRIYPADLYPMDYYSIDVIPQISTQQTGPMTLTVLFQDGTLQSQPLEKYGLDNTRRARFIWANQVPGSGSPLTLTYSLTYSSDQQSHVTDTITVTTITNILPVDLMTSPEPDARWTLTQTTGFTIHYIKGTKAERELDDILSEVSHTYTDMTTIFGRYRENVDIYVLDRIIGQGGYASSQWVAISYTDRSYTPIGLGPLLRHELTHRLDSAIGCSDAPAFLREGLAVFIAGGHYREEPITTKASAAVSGGHAISFSELLTDFYQQQHEISYLEAAAFLTYIYEMHNWEGIKDLCIVSSDTEGTDLVKFDAAIQNLADMDMSSFISSYRVWLNEQNAQSIESDLFELELKLMDLMRLYQVEYDQAAHFLSGILFNPQEGERQGIVADFVRGPMSAEAIAIELILSASQDAVIRQDVQFLKTMLSLLDSVLVERNTDIELFAEVMQVVGYLQTLDFEPYSLAFQGDHRFEIAVLDHNAWPQTLELQIGWQNNGWIITGVR